MVKLAAVAINSHAFDKKTRLLETRDRLALNSGSASGDAVR